MLCFDDCLWLVGYPRAVHRLSSCNFIVYINSTKHQMNECDKSKNHTVAVFSKWPSYVITSSWSNSISIRISQFISNVILDCIPPIIVHSSSKDSVLKKYKIFWTRISFCEWWCKSGKINQTVSNCTKFGDGTNQLVHRPFWRRPVLSVCWRCLSKYFNVISQFGKNVAILCSQLTLWMVNFLPLWLRLSSCTATVRNVIKKR